MVVFACSIKYHFLGTIAKNRWWWSVTSEGSRPKGLGTRAVLNINGKVEKPGCFKPFRFVSKRSFCKTSVLE